MTCLDSRCSNKRRKVVPAGRIKASKTLHAASLSERYSRSFQIPYLGKSVLLLFWSYQPLKINPSWRDSVNPVSAHNGYTQMVKLSSYRKSWKLYILLNVFSSSQMMLGDHPWRISSIYLLSNMISFSDIMKYYKNYHNIWFLKVLSVP